LNTARRAAFANIADKTAGDQQPAHESRGIPGFLRKPRENISDKSATDRKSYQEALPWWTIKAHRLI
jgi:hypothetical protein